MLKFIWEKQWQIYLLLERSQRNGCNNIYLHLKIFNMILKLISYLMSIYRLCWLNLSTPIFLIWHIINKFAIITNNNLTQKMTDLLVVWKIMQKLLQKCLSALTDHIWHQVTDVAQKIYLPWLLLIPTWKNQWKISLMLEKSLKNGVKYIDDVNFQLWTGNYINPHFSKYQSHKNNNKFICCLKIIQKWMQ